MMTVGKMIKLLSQFPEETEILISDGVRANWYRGDYEVQEWLGPDGTKYCDIGIGMCLEDDNQDYSFELE